VPKRTLEVTLPQMGESVTEGVVGTWRKRVGEQVSAGEVLVEVQTDKIDAEVPAPESGTLSKILAEEGQTIAVGAGLAEIELSQSGNGQSAAPSAPDQTSPAVATETIERHEAPETIEATAATDTTEQASPQPVGEVIEVSLPQMGESVTEGVVGTWLKKVGDPVSPGETIVEIQTDKIDAEVPSPAAGVVTEILVPEGETVAVGTVLARVTGSADGSNATAPVAPPQAVATSIPAAPRSDTGVEATPLARRRAALDGVDLGAVPGSGPSGLVRGADVSSAARPTAAPSGAEIQPIKGTRLALVQAMEASLAVPTATSFRTIEVGTLEARRSQLNQSLAGRQPEVKLSYTHLIAFALTWAAREMPVFSTSFARDQGTAQRVVRADVNLGLAVDLERAEGGRFLLVPVIKEAQRLDFPGFRARYEEMVTKTRTGSLQVADLEGATITLTNPGGVGTVGSVPRLMTGQSAIIAMGAIGRPAGLTGLDERSSRELGISPVMTVSSTYDHRLIQGVESGMLLRRLDQLLAGGDRFYELIAESLGVELAPLPIPAVRSAPAPAANNLPANQELMYAVAAGMSLVKAHRTHGHLAAHLDPLGSEPTGDPALEPETVKLTPELMAAVPAWMMRVMVPGDTLAEALPHMRETYCGTIAYEIEHISSHEQRVWLRKQIESGVDRPPLSPEQQLQLFRRLAEVDAFERFLRKTYLGQHTFSIEGLDALVPMLELTITLLAQSGTREVVLGMAHRGRLNITARIVGRSLGEIIAEFESGAYLGGASTGDVKYHYGAEGSYKTASGIEVGIALTHNPSHLEVVGAVVEGRTRALQTRRQGAQISQDTEIAVPVLIHGDAAFTGQGVVTETLNLQSLPGYRVGGTIHIIDNNQIGFTTEPAEGRSTHYASDVAKGYDIPIIHVNADDVEACLDAVRLAVRYRETFHRDVLIDLIGYRRLGHNEGDEPAYTQPLMMERIAHHQPVVQLYGAELVRRGLRSSEEVEQEQARAYQQMADAHAETIKQGGAFLEAAQPTGTMAEESELPSPQTQVPLAELVELDRQLVTLPAGFNLNPKLTRQLGQRARAFEAGGRVPWAQAEALALASLLTQGVSSRLTGQDTVRGTFSQRHLMLSDTKTGEHYAPVQHLPGAKAAIELYNSPLSEMGALGFEYGYGITDRNALVLWEAQYGDFYNNAQVVVDQFVVAGQAKWNQESRLTLLLPHGYEGSGPEHSSARIERFLELSAEGNIRVAYPSTAAQYFHILRLQALAEERRPLVLFTPKSGLRLASVSSSPEELAAGQFQPVLDDPAADHAQVRRLLISTGKISHELAARREQLGAAGVAVARLELLYPFPEAHLLRLLASYPALKEAVWVQEEPRNMGAFSFVAQRLPAMLPAGVGLSYAGRSQRAAPAEGSMRSHLIEQERVLERAFGSLQPSPPSGSEDGV